MEGAKTTVAAVGVLGGTRRPPVSWGCCPRGPATGRALEANDAVLEDPSAALAGVDVVLLVPGLGDERRGELAGAIEGAPATAAVPVLGLSALLKADPQDEQEGSVPWPWTVGALVGPSSGPCLGLRSASSAKRRPRSVVLGSVVLGSGVARGRRPSPALLGRLLPGPFYRRQEHL